MANRLGKGQREKVNQFTQITGSSEKVALQALKASDWRLEGAFDIFYSQPQIRAVIDSRQVEQLYNRYKDPYADMILVDGISLLCTDLQVDPQDIVMLVVSWHMKAATMCEFSREEFISGLQSLGVDSIEKFREKIPSMRAELKDEQKFCEIYNFAFGWAREKGQKSLSLETAIGMWQLLFAEKHWSLIEHWCNFLQVKHNKAISRDTWCQLLEFAKDCAIKMESTVEMSQELRSSLKKKDLTTGYKRVINILSLLLTIDPQLSNYDAEGAWPYLIDEFVEYLIENGAVQRRS